MERPLPLSTKLQDRVLKGEQPISVQAGGIAGTDVAGTGAKIPEFE